MTHSVVFQIHTFYESYLWTLKKSVVNQETARKCPYNEVRIENNNLKQQLEEKIKHEKEIRRTIYWVVIFCIIVAIYNILSYITAKFNVLNILHKNE